MALLKYQVLVNVKIMPPSSLYLKVTEQVLESSGVGNDGCLMAAINGSHQREGEMEDVAVEQ